MGEKIENIVLRHSARGMDILKQFMPENYAKKAAEMILSWKRGVIFLTTGFYVEGYAETDGPAGTVFLARALKELGFRPVIVSDLFCRDFFEFMNIEVVYMPLGAGKEWCKEIVKKYSPAGLISIERCGKNKDGKYANMRGVDISERTAQIDLLFELFYGKIPTIGVGDGGNEIGMGNVADVITEKLSLEPCVVKVDCLVIATVSNWGAYAIAAYLEEISAQKLMMSFEEIEEYISATVLMGSVDGVLKKQVLSVDGFGMEVEQEIVEALAGGKYA